MRQFVPCLRLPPSRIPLLLLVLAAAIGCATEHPQAIDANVDAPIGTGAALAEGVKRCATDTDCSADWPVCRCDGRCWGHTGAGAPEHGPSPRTVRYLLGGLRIVEDASATGAFGLDVDGATGGPAGACTGAADLVSPISGDPGVDNQVQAYLRYGEHTDAYVHFGEPAGSIGGSALDAMVIGQSGWMLEVSDIDSFEDDCFVGTRLLLVQTVEHVPLELGTACPPHADEASCLVDERNACVWSPLTHECRGIAPGQAVTTWAEVGTGTGRIGGGVLRTTSLGQMQLEIAIPLGSSGVMATQLYDTRFEARIDETTLTRGQLGAYAEMESLGIFLGSIGIGGGPTFTPEQLEALVRPDLAPDANGHCTRASAGFGFAALAVELVH
jgi:hypothetical protein